MKLGVVVLAAGQGTRMRSRQPKVLHQLAGRPLLAYVLDAAQAAGADRLCVVYGHGGEAVPEAMAGVTCTWVLQAERLGTGHALLQAMEAMADMDRVLVLYGDVPRIEASTLRQLIASAARTALGILTVVVEHPDGYGRIVRDHDGQVRRIVEHQEASEAERAIREINTGILVADRARLDAWLARLDNDNAQGEYYLTDVVALAVAEGFPVATTQAATMAEVSGVNDRVQLAGLERQVQRNHAERLMRAGVTLYDPARFDLRGDLTVGQDVTIDINCLFEGQVELGDGVSIGPHCCLKNCRIGAHTRIFAHSVIEDAQVGAEARIGPFARLRPQTQLADRVRIGNFVEIKKSEIGAGSKVNHLSYIGDTRIGTGVNVGAGTITCNYDGVHKHCTEIGDGAFIGSNTALVAPVTVGAGATIGAGSVIHRPAPPDRLTLTRAPQTTIDHWRPPAKKPPPG